MASDCFLFFASHDILRIGDFPLRYENILEQLEILEISRPSFKKIPLGQGQVPNKMT